MANWNSSPLNPSNTAPAHDLSHTPWYVASEAPVQSTCLICGGEESSDHPHEAWLTGIFAWCITANIVISYPTYAERCKALRKEQP